MIITQQFFLSEWSKAAIKHDPRTPFIFDICMQQLDPETLYNKRVYSQCALLYSTPKPLLLPKRGPNKLDDEVDTSKLEQNTGKLPQTRTHPSIKPKLPQL